MKKTRLKGMDRIKGDERKRGDYDFVLSVPFHASDQVECRYKINRLGYDKVVPIFSHAVDKK